MVTCVYPCDLHDMLCERPSLVRAYNIHTTCTHAHTHMLTYTYTSQAHTFTNTEERAYTQKLSKSYTLTTNAHQVSLQQVVS